MDVVADGPSPPWTGPPAAFDGFEVVRPLGAGGMGTVYVARERALGRLVAIKFGAAATDRDPRARERFAAEGRALARIQHPNVVSLFRIGEIDGHPYLVCELIVGHRLDELRAPIAWPDALRIGLGLARGVAVAHQRGVLHRDIKPANVMLTEDGLVKLLDFGLALLLEDDDAVPAPGPGAAPALRSDRVTQDGSVAGTPRYMAPELFDGAAATDGTDLYALGLVLHELLIGDLPNAGPRDLTDLPPALVRLIDDCVSPEPRERPSSAASICDHLERLARARPTAAGPRAVAPGRIQAAPRRDRIEPVTRIGFRGAR